MTPGRPPQTRWDPNEAGTPSSAVVDLAGRLSPRATVLDIGCGAMASNAVYLAEQGFSVHAFDISSIAVDRANARVHRFGLNVTIWQEDLGNYAPCTEYDAILCRGVLHFLSARHWGRAIAAIQRATAPAGWNALSIFDDSVPVPRDLKPIVHRIVRRGELRELYSDWEVLEEESYVLCDEHPDEIRHRHGITRFLARRPPR
jgi:cyclopropane fatty-acyl-phospholipid synthase-like methyltransferase